MDNIIKLDRENEAALTEHAQRFIRDQHKGNTMQALKAMMLLNGELQKQVDALSARARSADR